MTQASFELIRRQEIASLNLHVEEYVHTKTGAQHIHLAANNSENVFLVALRTVPHDSSGVAHILEHTALCGSQKYPVRDPFFMMVRRSLNTFMNAFTSSDWTAYPFASQNTKDFNNLLDVYLDAVFFSRLDELDFLQEGHRLEFSETENSNSDLVFKGVVFNEMKGAMSSSNSFIWHRLCNYLYPTTTYHFNSGGEPTDIPYLTYAQLKEFYRTHYHPSNAIFMTYGDIPAATHQIKMESQALAHFSALNDQISVPDEKRYLAPIYVEEFYPVSDDEDLAEKNHFVMAWLLGKATNLEESLEAQLLSHILLDNSASPLQQVLETTELGQAPSSLCGLDDSSRELAFMCGLEGCKAENAKAIEQLIFDCLQKIVVDGIDQADVEAALHQLELQQREVGGDGYPYGLQLILTSLTAATHRGDPIALLDIDATLARVREKIQSPDYIPQLIQKWLLDNQHRVNLLMKPDVHLQTRADQTEKNRLQSIKEKLSPAEKQKIIEQSLALQKRQLQVDDESILPKVTLTDIPPQLAYVAGSHEFLDANQKKPLRCYSAGTNGLVYQQVTLKMPALSTHEQKYFPYYCSFITELGLGDKNYLDVQRWQAQTLGSIRMFSSIRGSGDNVQAIDAYVTLSAKALARNVSALNQLMHATLNEVRFDELERLRELVAQRRARAEQSVTGQGHSLAMTLACAGMSPAAKLTHELNGLLGIAELKALDKSLDDAAQLKNFANTLASIHQKIIAAPQQFLIVGEEQLLEHYKKELAAQWNEDAKSAQNFSAFELKPVQETIREAWITNTQVNFCAKAYPTVAADHPDAAALTVLAGFLRNGFLHRSIREQGGAYGGGASQDNTIGAFRFYSYRDPRLEETLVDFDASLEWLYNTEHQAQPLEEAILGVVSSIDKPGSPAGEAKSTYQAELFNRTREKREAFRTRVTQVTLQDLLRVAKQYLDPAKASVGIVSHANQQEKLAKLGLQVHTL